MHRCLQVPELVALISSHLITPWYSTPAERRDLAMLARTSTVFSDHALRLLWASVALMNLLRCLPSDAYSLTEEVKMYNAYYRMTPRRSLEEPDFERVRFYARYIRRLDSDSHNGSAMVGSVRPWLSESMFPLLQRLTSICMPGDFPAASALVSQLATLPTAVFALSECVRGLYHIQTLYTDVLDCPALDHLSRLSSLQELILNGMIPTDFPTPGSQPLFPSLVYFYATEIDSASRFLQRGKDIALAALILKKNHPRPVPSTSDEMHRLLSAMESGISYSSLTDFGFTDGKAGSFDRSDALIYTIRASSLRCLFCFNNLTDVSIETVVGFDLDNATVADMARSWPHIKELLLQTRFGVSRPRTTLHCLEAFAEYCPDLVKLCISFDATVIPKSQGDFRLKDLMMLQVDASPISEADPVAQIILRICPRLTDVWTLSYADIEWEETEAEYFAIWQKVGSNLRGGKSPEA
ncbi:hypothetical protein FB45DRAFT_1137253 [Roridomyces roridus]|uniref:Uncharacterized protein n=1 Tax=Roridomyces roridus TaxID=1738132 RepID=A0AAD7F754_9AGAR|nr:hypothetical protein FB45DRAFT_1137253 [Roridomyces roridus]